MRKYVPILCLVVLLLPVSSCREKGPAGGRIVVHEHPETADAGNIVIEAEDFTGPLEPPMTVVQDEGASGGKCIRVEGGAGKPDEVHPVTGVKYPSRWGAAIYKFQVPKAGIWRLWGRRFWENGCGNSFTLVVNGRNVLFGEDETYDCWQWSPCRALFDLPASENTLEVLNREDGVKLDKIILTTDLDFIPQGME